MGVLSHIAKAKAQFQDYTVEKRKAMIMKKTEKVRADNLRQDKILDAKRELQEAEQINKDFRDAQGPSTAKKFGQGLASVMNKAQQAKKTGQGRASVMNKAQQAKKTGVGIGILKVSGSKALDSSVKANTFGGSNLNVGGGGGAFTFGPTPKEKPMPKKIRRVIVEL